MTRRAKCRSVVLSVMMWNMNSVLTIQIIRDNTNAGGWGYEDEGGYGYGEEDTVEDLNARQGELNGGRNPFWHIWNLFATNQFSLSCPECPANSCGVDTSFICC